MTEQGLVALSDAERERARQAMQNLAPVFAEMRRAMEAFARAAAPALQQAATALASVSRDDYALAPARPGKSRGRGPGRRGREAQRSPYGPQGGR